MEIERVPRDTFLVGGNMNSELNDRYQISHEILAYLTDHPEAQDTIEGIMKWTLDIGD